MVVASFSVVDKANRVRFFEESFLITNISPEVVLKMPFLTLSGANIDFPGWELWWKTYITEEALRTTKRIELVGKKEFMAATLDPKYKTYVVHVASLSSTLLVASMLVASPGSTPLDVHTSRRPQISGLIAKEASTKVPAKHLDFADVFSLDLTSKLSEHIKINDHAIELVDNQQPPYSPIYNLESMELETLKAYIKTNLANGFIRPSKSPAGASILFDRKSDGSFRLCVNYRGLNNLMIKNLYPLPLIEESLDSMRRVKRFT